MGQTIRHVTASNTLSYTSVLANTRQAYTTSDSFTRQKLAHRLARLGIDALFYGKPVAWFVLAAVKDKTCAVQVGGLSSLLANQNTVFEHPSHVRVHSFFSRDPFVTCRNREVEVSVPEKLHSDARQALEAETHAVVTQGPG
jgi:hypothetical protein